MDLKRWLLIAAALFCAGLFIGLLVPDSTAHEIEKAFQDIAGGAASASGLTLFFLLFINNALAVSVSFFFSPIFLILPVLSVVMNGAVLSIVGRLTLQDHSLAFLAAGILPHGIIEIPAYLLAQASAMCFGFTAIRSVFKVERRAAAGPILRRCLGWLGIAIVLLIPAALIEAFITPVLLDLFK
jgi:stage II sporulation protein M